MRFAGYNKKGSHGFLQAARIPMEASRFVSDVGESGTLASWLLDKVARRQWSEESW